MVVFLNKITTENHQSISFHFTYVYEGLISHRLLSPSLNHIFRKYINMLYSYLSIGMGCFPLPCTFCNVSNYNNYMSVCYRICVFCSYVLCPFKCATLCIQMMCFNKLLLTFPTFDYASWEIFCEWRQMTSFVATFNWQLVMPHVTWRPNTVLAFYRILPLYQQIRKEG